MKNEHVEKGRAFALSAYGIRWVAWLTTAYLALVSYAVVVRGTDLSGEMLTPFVFGVSAVAAMAGVNTIPNVAERWGGKPPQ